MTLPSVAPRIASLVPSVTELLVALGLGPLLVARTGYCVHPAEALAGVAKVGGTKDVNLVKLERLAPTHVIVNVDENRQETARALRHFVPQVIVTHPCGPDDVDALIARMAEVFAGRPGVSERARALRAELAAELAATAPTGRSTVPVLYLIWRDPWMTVARDTYIARMLARVGWCSLPAVEGGAHGAARYPVLSGGEPWLTDVREVLLSSEPYAFEVAHRDEAQQLCPGARVRLVDGELLSWYGPRTAAGLRYLRALAAA
ncbi:MAG: helical backbone metal receptor [Aquincola sp.]|nr:helical backbone metal receptor [Aquincola sp.]